MDLKLDEVASLLDVSEQTILQWLNEGTIPSYSMQNEYRFSRDEIEDWLLHNQKLMIQERASDDKEAFRDLSLKYSLYKAIHRGGVLCDIIVRNKEEALACASKYIADKFQLDESVLFEMLSYRESLMSTGLGEGLALPHAKDFLINAYYDIVVPMFLREPIEYGALDGRPVNILFFLFACQDKSHLNLVNKIVHLGMSLEARSFFRNYPNKDQLLAYVKEWESQTH
ncbi:Nitrogen regulatory protein,PTS system sugar transporter subunit IIA,PTS system, fructose subfamily, IIA component,Phosphoenolpyruvate-dependent sugar phosphotransferase system, EIIA 2 [Chlamydia serpentis]|uniref:Nitrogen regulatory protein,PTS system sugar transporter subunit IIA,PTS system, fructose subfamily, IIA component,Phosphoenolpyruvate-dependent sugar phosphotransferase system, EIIA 2 n=1 Tax=Chlamydia serpentis TaxID=1967782 RepID=A0A2R8FA85_9CHLA|nr:PTS sugar transporter subunit IIA [Chlamydia serpentis]SPN73232.1 Nitrogen regulatory protein,PTS system sugar transporter subunit IIA,PTS system, fructose subfamily, IIA component,Phosphoenolpyruvate-dependent sugar phosphotransferase system, EIIA 2 [Chlamydia serpentis]